MRIEEPVISFLVSDIGILQCDIEPSKNCLKSHDKCTAYMYGCPYKRRPNKPHPKKGGVLSECCNVDAI